MVCIDESKKGIDNTRASHPQLHMQRNEAADGRQLGKTSKRRTWQRKRREPEIFGGWSELPLAELHRGQIAILERLNKAVLNKKKQQREQETSRIYSFSSR